MKTLSKITKKIPICVGNVATGDAAKLLYDKVTKLKKRPSKIISASAIGYYGSDTKQKECFENTPSGRDFIGQFVFNWEQQISLFEKLGMQVSILRIGIVLSKAGGALPKLSLPISWGIGAPIGSGRQSISWIHLDDLVKMFVFVAILDRMLNVISQMFPSMPEHLILYT